MIDFREQFQICTGPRKSHFTGTEYTDYLERVRYIIRRGYICSVYLTTTLLDRTAGMSEAFGRGFEKMSLPYREQGVALPEYEALPQDFLAIFTNIVVAKGIVSRDMNGKEITSGGGNEIPEGLTDKERLILEIISKGEFTTIQGVSERLSISHASVERSLKSLVVKQLIERVGSDRKGSWRRI